MFDIAGCLTGQKFMIKVNSCIGGRYEISKNKGYRPFHRCFGTTFQVRKYGSFCPAFIFIPADHYGPRKDLLNIIDSGCANTNGKFLTHNLHDVEYDKIINRIEEVGLQMTLAKSQYIFRSLLFKWR